MTDELPAQETAEAPLAYRAVRGGLWVALSSYWMVGFGFAINIIMTRLLTPEAFGLVALAGFWAQLLRVQPKLGLGYAFAQHRELDGRSVGTYVRLESAAALVGLVLTAVVAPLLPAFGYPATLVPIVVVLAVAATLEGLGGIWSTLLDRELRFRQTSLLQSVLFPLSYAPALWLATHGGGVWSLVAQTLAYNAMMWVGVWLSARRNLGHLWRMDWRFDQALARGFVRFGVNIGMTVLAAMLLTQLDNFLVGTFVGVALLGFYDRAYRTAQWPATLLNSLIARTAFYTYARLQDDRERLQKSVTLVLWIIAGLALPLALAIFITAPDLIRLLYGERWLPAVPFLRILVLISVLRPVWENASTLFIAIGQPRLPMQFTIVQAAVLAGIGLPLTLTMGAYGTLAGVVVAFAVGMTLVYRAGRRELDLPLRETLGPAVLAAGATLVVYAALNRLVGFNALPLVARVAVKGAYAVAAFFGAWFALQPSGIWQRLRYIARLALAR